MDDLTRSTLLLHTASTLAMVGLIWFVQIVHYPLFAKVGEEGFVDYGTSHCRLTSFVVMPLMLTELATSLLLLVYRPPGISTLAVGLGIALLAFIWLVTFFVQVPQHSALSLSFDADVQRKLVLGNWLRTAAWSARGVLVLWIIWQLTSRWELTAS